jgi:phage terminase large subunit
MKSGLTLSEAAHEIAAEGARDTIDYAVCSPDLWNRRQDSGRSGAEVMGLCPGMPPMIAADNRRIIGWRCLREYMKIKDGKARLRISDACPELLRTLPLLLFDRSSPEDASSDPHSVTHAPEALRYAVMSILEKGGTVDREERPAFKMSGDGNNLTDY